MKVRFFAAQKLVPLDKKLIGKASIDAYVKLEHRGQKLKTKTQTQEEGGQIHWNQEFLIPAQLPLMGGRLVFKVFDEDLTLDEIVGSIVFQSKNIIGAKNGIYLWKNVYGAPMDVSGTNATQMNENPEIASLWKGRILIQLLAEKTEKPVLRV